MVCAPLICESGEGVRLPRERGRPPGKSRELPGKFAEVAGKSRKLSGNLWIAIQFHSGRTSGEVAGKLPGKFGKFQGSPGTFQKLGGS